MMYNIENRLEILYSHDGFCYFRKEGTETIMKAELKRDMFSGSYFMYEGKRVYPYDGCF